MFRKEGAQGVDACSVSHTPEMVGLPTPDFVVGTVAECRECLHVLSHQAQEARQVILLGPDGFETANSNIKERAVGRKKAILPARFLFS